MAEKTVKPELGEKSISKGEPHSRLHTIWTILWKTGRVLFWLATFATIILFWWIIIGIGIALLFFLLSDDPDWKRNWAVLAFILGFATLLGEGIGPFWLLLPAFIFLLYAISVGFIAIGRGILRLVRKKPATKGFKTKAKKITSKVHTGLKVAIIAIPLLMWFVVSIDFGVMFNNNPHLLWVHTPSTVSIGEDFSITVEAWDVYERLSGNYQGQVEFSLRSYNLTSFGLINSPEAQLPSPYTFTGQPLNIGGIPAYTIADGKDNGRHVFSAHINTTGIHYLLVNDSLTGNTYWSNPIIVENLSSTDRKLYWGDLHSHSLLSDGSGTPEHSFYYARYIACLDFHSLSDHGEDLSAWGFSDWFYAILEAATNQANAPGAFVAFHGAEWTPHYPPSFLIDFGHYTCIVSGDTLPRIGSQSQKSPAALWQLLDDYCNTTGERALAMPHHTIREQFIQDWTYVNPDYVKLAETSSVHGECLFEGHDSRNYRGSVDVPQAIVNGAAIIDAYKMGYRMTLIASGDNHDGHPGHSLSHTDAYIGHQWPFAIDTPRNGHPYPSGITATYADNLTRKGIFDALYNQRVFGNSDYGRPILNFSINGISIWENTTVTVATNSTQRNISVFLAQDGAPAPGKATAATVTANWAPNWNATIEIIKNGIIWNTTTVNSPIFKIELNDSSIITGDSYDSCILKDGKYYINEFSDNPVDPLSLNTSGVDFYLVRVVGANGRTSFAGPIWVESLS